jgi:hypothetical protein
MASLAVCLSKLEWMEVMEPEAHMFLARRIQATEDWAKILLTR